MTELKFFIYGTPAPQGSKRHVGNGRMIESSKAVGPWRSAVAWQGAAAVNRQGFGDVPVEVDIDFYLPRPKSAPKSRIWPDRKPDLDKLIRSTLDGLVEAGATADDARVQSVRAQKLYAAAGEPCGAEIALRPVGEWVALRTDEKDGAA